MKRLLLSGVLVLTPVANAQVIEVPLEQLQQMPSEGDIWIHVQNGNNFSQYQARFLVQMNEECIQRIDFSSPETLDAINRKTQFTANSDGTLTGTRPVGFLDIVFTTDVETEVLDDAFGVKQSLYDYNRFVDSADFQFTLTPLENGSALVDLEASNRVSDDIPAWLSGMFQSDAGNKVEYFQSALNQLCK